MAKTRSVFSQAELDYLHGQRLLGRIATVGADGTPHVAPVGWAHNAELDTIDVTGHGLEQTKKFRDVARTGRTAIVIDDLASTSPWRPRAIEVRGQAEALRTPEALIRIHPERIVSWGHGPVRSARTVTRAHQRPEDVPDAVQQPTPAAQRPRIGQMADRLLYQRTEARLHAVERPLLAGQPVLGPPIPDRRMPVLTRPGHAPETPVEDGGDLNGVQHLVQP